MPGADLFKKLGLCVMPDVLPADRCKAIADEMLNARQKMLQVVDSSTGTVQLKLDVRRTRSSDVSDTVSESIYDLLVSLRESLANHFHMKLTACEKPQFLVYLKGDYFKRHTDSDCSDNKPQYVRDRKVSVILFLNNSSSSFEGGDLVFYDLFQNPLGNQYGFPLRGEAGLLIAFPANLSHEVTPVVRGNRCTIAGWFY